MATAGNLSGFTRTPTGFEILAADWCKIHAELFSEFVSAVIEDVWHNRVFRELVRGFVAVSLVLLERLGETPLAQTLATRTGIEDSVLESLRSAMSQL